VSQLVILVVVVTIQDVVAQVIHQVLAVIAQHLVDTVLIADNNMLEALVAMGLAGL
jgi:hypothetical protein